MSTLPKKRPKRKRPENIYFRMTVQERDELEKAAQKANMTILSEFVRHVVLTHIRGGQCSVT